MDKVLMATRNIILYVCHIFCGHLNLIVLDVSQLKLFKKNTKKKKMNDKLDGCCLLPSQKYTPHRECAIYAKLHTYHPVRTDFCFNVMLVRFIWWSM